MSIVIYIVTARQAVAADIIARERAQRDGTDISVQPSPTRCFFVEGLDDVDGAVLYADVVAKMREIGA